MGAMGKPQFDIRPYRLEDVDDLYEAARESVAEVSTWLPWCHPDYTVDESRQWVSTRPELFADGVEYNFTIRDEANAFVGGCGLNNIQGGQMANLGYWVRSSQTGRGAATAAVEKLAAFAFEKTKLIRLEIVCAVGNRASQRVAEKAGALREALLRDRLWGPDGPRDAVLYTILRSGRHLPGADG